MGNFWGGEMTPPPQKKGGDDSSLDIVYPVYSGLEDEHHLHKQKFRLVLVTIIIKKLPCDKAISHEKQHQISNPEKRERVK